MTQNPVPKDTSLTPLVVGKIIRRSTVTLTTNFGQRRFRFLTDAVLQCIEHAQAEFGDNPERLPRVWSRYPEVLAAQYEEDDCVVIYKGLMGGKGTLAPSDADVWCF